MRHFRQKMLNAPFLTVVIIVLIVWGLLFYSGKQDHEYNIQQQLNDSIQHQNENWTAVQTLFIGNVQLCFDTFIKKPAILDLLQKATDSEQRDEARIELYRTLYGHYKTRRDYTNGRFSMAIHSPDQTNLLRFAQPEQFGDDLTDIRPTILQAHLSKRPVHSFDHGRIQATYHHIMPVIHHGKLLGSIEYGRPFSSLKNALEKFSPDKEFHIIYRQDLANMKRLKKFQTLYAESLFSPLWVSEDPAGLLKSSPKPLSERFTTIAALAQQDPDFQTQLNQERSFAKIYPYGGQHYVVVVNAINDIEATHFASLISIFPSTAITSLENRFIKNVLAMTFLILLVGIGLLMVFRSLRSKKSQSDYLESIHDTMSEGLYVTDAQGNITLANESAQSLLGYREDEMLGQNAKQLFCHPDWKVAGNEDTEGSYHPEIKLQRSDHKEIWVELSSRPLMEDHKFLGMVNVFSDISEQKVKDDALRIAATAFETQDGIMITDTQGHIIQVNKAFTRLTGFQPSDVLGEKPNVLSSGRQPAGFYEKMWERLNKDNFWQGEIWNRRKDGELFLEWLTITAVLNHKNEVTHYVANFTDVTDRQKAQDEIQQLAYYDSLTKLPNRRLLLDRLEQAMRYTKRTKQCGALFFIDLDNFKTLNDSKGHLVGDELLKQVAKRLQQSVREVDTIARLGGDEFVVLLENLGECKVDAIHHSEKLALTILETFDTPFTLDGQNHLSSPSIGVEILHPKNRDTNEILAHADLAMYQAKKQGRNTVRFFDPEMQSEIDEVVELQGELREALKDKSLSLYYQAQVNQYTQIIGCEALIRWQHPERGFISPAQFIPMAENSGLIIPLGDFVLQTACETLKAWSSRPEFENIKLSVNVSAKQFAEPNFIEKVKTAIQQTGANPHLLKLELTESLIVQDVENTIDTMNELRDFGIEFSMDDFGTGHSSLSYLKRLPLSQLKIDQSFIRDLTKDSDDATIVKTIIAMSNTLKLEVVAEGVETGEQKEFLQKNQCYLYQGYLFSRPVPLNDFEDLVQTTHDIHDFDFELD